MVILGFHNTSYIVLGQNSISFGLISHQKCITIQFLRYYFDICFIMIFALPLCQQIFDCYAQ